jgi:GTP 3',8-cyclase
MNLVGSNLTSMSAVPVEIRDTLARPVRDLRISVTDRCNFRCTYCMPKEIFGKDYEFLARDLLLSFEELERVVRAFVRLGATKVRLTGGEPLLRKGIEDLVARIALVPGVQDLTLTTNGSLLARKAAGLAAAGLKRVTVSLDSMDDTVFMAMNDVGYPVQAVLDGIEAAAAAGLAPVKINMVTKRGVNDHSIVGMAGHFRGTGHVVRFIEYMDVGYPLEPVGAGYRGEVARRYRYKDGAGEIGVISSVTQPFCGDCTRARLSAEGGLYTCLFATKGTDLRHLLREGATDAELDEVLSAVWGVRSDRYSEIRSEQTKDLERIEMSYIGG